jgi:hypothetical protein
MSKEKAQVLLNLIDRVEKGHLWYRPLSDYLKLHKLPNNFVKDESIREDDGITEIMSHYKWSGGDNRERHDTNVLVRQYGGTYLFEGNCDVYAVGEAHVRGGMCYQKLELTKLDEEKLELLLKKDEIFFDKILQGLERVFRQAASSSQVQLDRLTRSHERILITGAREKCYFDPNDREG